MRIVVTGTPGTGKTLLANSLSLFFGLPVVNDTFFVKQNSLGSFDKASNEFEVSVSLFKKRFFEEYSRIPSWIAEGHLFCEFDCNADLVIVLRTDPLILESRLESRGYTEEKIQDNVMCEAFGYCLENALKNYGSERVFEVNSSTNFNNVFFSVVSIIDSLKVFA